MKRSYLPLMAILVVMVSCSGAFNDLDKLGLKGNIKTIIEYQYGSTYQDDKWVADEENFFAQFVINYDREGKYVNMFNIGVNMDTVAVASCRRENGDIVEETFVNKRNGQITRTLMERVSDEQVNFELWLGEQMHHQGALYFDSKGRLVKKAEVVNDRDVILIHIFEKDLLVESRQEDLEGNPIETRLYEYDSFDKKGNWTTQLVYMEDEKITPTFVIKREFTYY
jgi:hypothetical protein